MSFFSYEKIYEYNLVFDAHKTFLRTCVHANYKDLWTLLQSNNNFIFVNSELPAQSPAVNNATSNSAQ